MTYKVIFSLALLISTMKNYGKMPPSIHTFITGHLPEAGEDESRTEAWMATPHSPTICSGSPHTLDSFLMAMTKCPAKAL